VSNEIAAGATAAQKKRKKTRVKVLRYISRMSAFDREAHNKITQKALADERRIYFKLQ
jgi:hypothetical protein